MFQINLYYYFIYFYVLTSIIGIIITMKPLENKKQLKAWTFKF